MPTAITAQAFGASWSIHQFTVSGCPVSGSLPNEVQYPSPSMMFWLGIEPSMTRMNGSSSPGRGRAERGQELLAALVGESTLLCRWTLGSPGMRPSTTSSMDGLSAAVIEIVSPSQLMPSEIHRMCISSRSARARPARRARARAGPRRRAGRPRGVGIPAGAVAAGSGSGRRRRCAADPASGRPGPPRRRVIDVGDRLRGLPLDRGTRLRARGRPPGHVRSGPARTRTATSSSHSPACAPWSAARAPPR